MSRDLSVIIVSWNAKEFLTKCLDSVIENTLDFKSEIIVVDNNSTDGSAELVRVNYPSVTLLRNTSNIGFARANNIGISQSSGKYLVLVNSDVLVGPGCLQSIYEFMEYNKSVGIVGPQILDSNGRVQRSCMGSPTPWNTFCRALALDTILKHSIFSGFLLPLRYHNATRRVDVINGCFWMVRRKAIDEVGLLDNDFFMYAEDIDWCKRFWQKSWEVVFLPSAKAIHFGGASSSNAPIRFYLEMHKSNLKYWRKHCRRSLQCFFYINTTIQELIRVVINAIFFAVSPQSRIQSRYKIKRGLATIRWLFLPE